MTEPTQVAFTETEIVALFDLLAEVKKAFRVSRIANPTPQQVLTALEKLIADKARIRGPKGYSKGVDADVRIVRARQYEQMREPAFLIGLLNKLRSLSAREMEMLADPNCCIKQAGDALHFVLGLADQDLSQGR